MSSAMGGGREAIFESCDPETFQMILTADKAKYDIFTLDELLPLGIGPSNFL